MHTGNLIFLAIAYTALLLMIQRTERKRMWLVAIFLLVPIGYMTYQWAILREQTRILPYATGTAITVNFVFWLLYGRKHPPGSSDDIKVIGMED